MQKNQESLTHFRQNLYKTVDTLITTGNPLFMKRNGHTIKLSLVATQNKLSRLKPHKTLLTDGKNLENMSPAKWNEVKNL